MKNGNSWIILANLTWVLIILSYGLIYGGTHAPDVAKWMLFVFCRILGILINIPIAIFIIYDFWSTKSLELWAVLHLIIRISAIFYFFG